MFNFLKNKPDKETEKQKIEYFENLRDSSGILDKAILTFSSLFLGFLFSQLQNLLKIEIINENYLIFSIISIGLTIFLVLFSYIIAIYQSKIGYKILVGEVDYDEGMCDFNKLDCLIDILRISYFITFIIPIIFTILFYITNLKNYVG
ncbi:MAG: hypothetical protein Q9M94_07645 [Candidatus Gracilibacteria bacterium]|nr:hypothetical protein [Candidatus Gracilibacteria bacterium]